MFQIESIKSLLSSSLVWDKIIYLLGFACSGKSTLGRQIASYSALPFLDLDDELERFCGYQIKDYVEKYGWDSFRMLESDLLLHSAEGGENSGKSGRDIWQTPLPLKVIATGGGIVCRSQNREFLQNPQFYKLWLHPPFDLILMRLENKNHPRFENLSTIEIREEYEKRCEWYAELADGVYVEGNLY